MVPSFQNPSFLSANIVLCETVLIEKTDMLSVIRTMDTITLPLVNNHAHFFVVTRVYSQPGDFQQHTLKIQVTGLSGSLIAQAEDYRFSYGYKMDPVGPGGFVLTTEFNIDVRPLVMPAKTLVSAFLDGQSVARTPLMLRRG